MPKYEIVETLRRVVEDESWDEVQRKYRNQEIILDSEDFVGYEINDVAEFVPLVEGQTSPVTDVAMAIIEVIEKRVHRGASKDDILNWLEHLKKDVWKNNDKLLDFIDRLKGQHQTPVNPA